MALEPTQRDLELGLDFTDTVDWRNARQGRVRVDGLPDYGKLIEWSLKRGLVSGDEARRLERMARDSGKDKTTLKRAVELRESIYRIFSAIAHEERPENRDLDTLNVFLSEGLAKSRIVRAGEGFQWSWRGAESPEMMLWPIARSAADLLTSDRLDDVGECANEEEGCGCLFLDNTKSHTKKWCSSTSCGNRAKVRRFYEAHKGESS